MYHWYNLNLAESLRLTPTRRVTPVPRPWYAGGVPRRRFEKLPEEQRERLFRVAAKEFARSGFQGTSYNRLLERLELGKSSAYYYFDDKRDLFLAAVEHCYRSYFAAIGELEPPRDAAGFWDFALHTSTLGFEFMQEDPTAAALMQCMQRERALLGELGSDRLLATLDTFYEDLVRLGQRLGAVRSDLPRELLVQLARDVTMSFDRWFVGASSRRTSATTPKRAAELYVDVIRRVLSPR